MIIDTIMKNFYFIIEFNFACDDNYFNLFSENRDIILICIEKLIFENKFQERNNRC